MSRAHPRTPSLVSIRTVLICVLTVLAERSERLATIYIGWTTRFLSVSCSVQTPFTGLCGRSVCGELGIARLGNFYSELSAIFLLCVGNNLSNTFFPLIKWNAFASPSCILNPATKCGGPWLQLHALCHKLILITEGIIIQIHFF